MDVKRVLFELSKLSDSIEGNDTFHQRRVAVIAVEIAKQLGFDEFGIDLVLKSALIHDIALLSDTSKVETFRQIVYEEFDKLQRHATLSGRVARFFNLHLDITTAINLHHTRHSSNPSVIGSILFLADNIEIAHRSVTNPFAFDEIFEFLNQKKELFDADIMKAFETCSKRECFWFYMLDENVDNIIEGIIDNLPYEEADDKLKTAVIYFMAFASDRVAPFFDSYSVLVKNIATSVAYGAGVDVKRIRNAALVSHIGNLVLPFDLFKKESIDAVEFNLIKSHTLEARNRLKKMGFDDIADIVFSHHENAAKDGYPCGISAGIEAQIVGVSSFVAAMMQDRPYRAALTENEIKKEIDTFRDRYDKSVIESLLKIDLDRVLKTRDEHYEAVRKLFV